MAYFGLWILQFGIALVGDVSHLTLLSLSKEFANAETPDAEYFRTIGFALVEGYFWPHFLSLILFSAGAGLFYYLLFRFKLIPRFLALWGVGAVAVVHGATWAQIFDYSVSFNLYMQNGVFMLAFTGWLLVKGFRSAQA